MMRNIKVEHLIQTPIEKQQIELVERKGIGHPDSISDGLAEAASRALCAEYIKKCGAILHHNTDETQIVAGESNPMYGGGEILKPIYALLVGRATKEFKGKKIAVEPVILSAARDYIRNTLPNIDIEKDIILDCKYGTGSSDLCNVFNRNIVPMSNDTSFGVGHAPFSELENIVYNTERMLLTDLKNRIPAIGEDIKVMGFRNIDEINLTVGCAMVGKYVDDISHYITIKNEIRDYVTKLADRYTDRAIVVNVNTADDIEKNSVYLTVTGTSAEMGDDGSVGRGNRCNGLITPNRPMSMEATSGKNPINHVGKIYNLLSMQMANDIVKAISDVEDVHIRILSQIGKPIDQPLVANAQIIPKDGANFNNIKSESESVINDWLSNITKITECVTKGELNTF